MSIYGPTAERKAANFLRRKRYSLVDFNYTTRFGEIDLIFTKKKYLIFVEVKARDENSIAEPIEFIDPSKKRKLIASAQLYLAYHHTDLQPRFDIVEVVYKKDKIKSIKHLENAFTLD